MNDLQGDLFEQKYDMNKVLEAFKPFDELNKYFNTTGLKGKELKQHEFRTGTQNRLILDCFKERPDMELTPFEVRVMTHQIYTPITSIRRAMTTLTDMGYLVKTQKRKPGEYGELNYTWKLK